jgi:predicted nucleic acid-binding protein
MSNVLLDTSTLSEVIKGRNLQVAHRARQYLAVQHQFTFILIAATAIYHNLDLVTENTRHFKRIPLSP